MTRSRYVAFEVLSRNHSVVCVPPDEVIVEHVVIAIGNIIGMDKICAASQMNKRVVVFIAEESLVHEIVVAGLSTDSGRFILVSPLKTPVVEILISNVLPFINSGALLAELSRYGAVVSQI